MLFFRWTVTGLALVIFCGPLFQLALEARVIDPGVWSHLKNHQLPAAVLETLIFAFGSAGISLLTGAAWLLISLRVPRLAFLCTLSMALLLALPAYVYGFVTLAFLDFSGPVQTFLLRQFGENAFFEPRTRFWAVFFFGLASSPYVYFSLLAGLKARVQDFTEASVSLGAGFGRTVLRVLAPALSPWALGGAGLVALEAGADFGFIDLFGINTLSRLLYKSWGALFSFGGAARISLLLLLFCLLLMWLLRRTAREGSEPHPGRPAQLRHLFPLTAPGRFFVYSALVCGVLLFNILPLASLAVFSADLSLWRELPWGAALFSTLRIGFSAAAVAGGLMAVLFFVQRHSRFSRLLSLFALGYGLPGTLLAVAFFIFCSRLLPAPLSTAPPAALLLALSLVYFVKFGGLMLRGLRNRRPEISAGLLEAAHGLGSPARAWWRVEFPLYRPALTLGFFLLFLETVKELPAALMLRPFAEPALSLRIHQYAAESDWARAAVFSLVLAGLVLTGMILQKLLIRERNAGE